MATEEAGPQAGDHLSKRDEHASLGEDTLKRKASLVDDDDIHAKRHRHDTTDQSPASASEPYAQGSPSLRRPSRHDVRQDRRESATQEERTRGKRLFGGLMSTLSQTGTNSQHKRRQEIERRQQERLQKKRDEDDLKRAEQVAKIREARLYEQVGFQEQVMRHKHSKMLRMAAFLKTKAEPPIYYLPWKTTAEQEDTIDDQISEAKSKIAKEEEDFKVVKEQHAIRYGSRRESQSRGDKRDEDGDEKAQQPERHIYHDIVKKEGKEPKPAEHHDSHDESGDVLVEADEDMVIY